MNDLFFLERKETTEELPLSDNTVSNRRLIGLFLLTAGIFSLYLLVGIGKIHLFNSESLLTKLLVPNVLIFLFLLSYWLCTTYSPFKLFKIPRWADLKIGLLIFLSQVVYSLTMSSVLAALNLTAENRAALEYAKLPHTPKVFSILALDNFSNLMIEEIISIFFFLTINAILFRYLKRSTAIGLAWILSGVLFSLLHFDAYNWHLAQMFLIIGVERLFMTGVYIRTRNLWISFMLHYIFDMIIFLSVMLVQH